MNEIWKNIKSFPNYAISNFGNVKSLGRIVNSGRGGLKVLKDKILKQKTSPDGYKRIGIYIGKKQRYFFVHILVLESFVGRPSNDVECNHIDTNKANNKLSNLEWLSHQNNQKHALENDLYLRGEDVFGSKLKKSDVIRIRRMLSAQKLKQKEIAVIFNVSDTTISDIKLEKIWTHL